MSNETAKIKERYARRKSGGENQTYSSYVIAERESEFKKIITNNFNSKDNLKILEIGAGGGGNISFFKDLGIQSDHIYANELLDNRVIELRTTHPDIHVFSGNALDIPENNKFDIIFQSTVFTSILNNDFRRELALKMVRLLKEDGIIIWYDFTFNNPKNKDVKKVDIKEVHRLFSGLAKVYSKKCTLAPPIGRRVGKLYPVFNFFPFLRSHYIAVFKK